MTWYAVDRNGGSEEGEGLASLQNAAAIERLGTLSQLLSFRWLGVVYLLHRVVVVHQRFMAGRTRLRFAEADEANAVPVADESWKEKSLRDTDGPSLAVHACFQPLLSVEVCCTPVNA